MMAILLKRKVWDYMMTKQKKVRKTYDDLTFADDFLFSKVLENNPELCKELVELILGVKIRIVNEIGRERSIEITPDNKGVRLDVYMEGDDKIYNLEMQNANKKDLPRRSRYYQSLLDLGQVEKGASYEKLQDSFIIFICRFDPFGYGYNRYTVKSVIEEAPNIQYNDGANKLFLSTLPNQKGEMSEGLRQFLDYVDGRGPSGVFTQKLDEAVKRARLRKSWRKEYMLLEEIREEGREEGREYSEKYTQKLTQLMENDSRTEELLAALKDRTLLHQLYEEYHIDTSME